MCREQRCADLYVRRTRLDAIKHRDAQGGSMSKASGTRPCRDMPGLIPVKLADFVLYRNHGEP
jgi:hypothetical protein